MAIQFMLFMGIDVGMGILAVVFAFGRVVFGVNEEGSFVGFIGMLIAALGKTPEAARGLATLATLLMVMPSGARVPSFIFPAWMQTSFRRVGQWIGLIRRGSGFCC